MGYTNLRNILYYNKHNRYANIGLMRIKYSIPDVVIKEFKSVDGLLKIKNAILYLDTTLDIEFKNNELSTLINNGVMFNFIDFKGLIDNQQNEFFEEFNIAKTPENIEKYLKLEERFKYIYGDYPEQVRRTRIKQQQELGKYTGRKKGDKFNTKLSILAKETILKESKDFNGSLSDKELINKLNINNKTYYKYKKELKNGN